jgi:hypothetical protein
MRKCTVCGGHQFSEGDIVSSGMHLFVYGTPMEFRPLRSRSKLPIFGEACLNCGHLQMVVDPEELRRKKKK